MIKAIIFDLDDCLMAPDELGAELIAPVFDAIKKTNKGILSDEGLQRAFADFWHHPLDVVARKHAFSDEMLAAASEANACIEVQQPLHGYSDLGTLSELAVRLFLVTSGFRRFQLSKIQALGFEHLFTDIYVDAIDEDNRKGKEGIFQDILITYLLRPEEVMVVGDNPHSEIEAGNRLNMKTVQILREGVSRGNNARHYICQLPELKTLIDGG